MTHPEPHDLTALAYGLIEGDERDALLEHLSDCDACREVYDSYRDEQVTVRDSILADARSGAAEAKALESTLRMLGAIDTVEVSQQEEEKRGRPVRHAQGRLIRMPMWLIAVEVAAVLVVALGLFLLLNPDNTDNDKEETVAVAEQDRAPAEVEQGVAYVQDNRGDWKQADAVPVDEWVKTGDGVFAFTLSDGSRTELEPNSMFRISLEDGTAPIVYMLHGNGTIDTGNVAIPTYVRAGETGFYAGPGAKIEMICEGDGVVRPRTWTAPKSVKARVLKGDVMVYSDGKMKYIPLKTGEELKWDGEEGFQFKMTKAGAFLVPSGTASFHLLPFDPHGEGETPVDGGVQAAELRKHIEVMLPRYQEWDSRWEGSPKWKGNHEKRMQEMQKALEEMREQLETELREIEGEFEGIDVEIEGDIYDVSVLAFEDLGFTITLVSDGKRLKVDMMTPDGKTTTHQADSIEKLKESLKPEIAELLDGVETERDDDGNLRIRGVESSGQTVKIKSRSRSHKSNSTDD